MRPFHILIAAALSFSSANAFAQKTVTEVDLGACWVSEEQPGFWKVASFNDGVAFQMADFRLATELNPNLKTALKKAGLDSYEKASFEMHLYCSGAGHTLLLNFWEADRSLCVLTDGNLKNFRIGTNPDKRAGLCFGAEPQGLIIMAKDTAAVHELMRLLKEPRYNDMIGKLSPMPMLGMISVELREKYRFREAFARDQIFGDKALNGWIDGIDFNRTMLISGSSLYLMKGEYPGH